MPTTTHDTMDHLYNNELAVPDWKRYVDSWAERSACARENGRWRTASYGSHDLQTCDIHEPLPSAVRARTLLVFLHGGYWHRGDKAMNAFVAPAFTNAGITVALPNYRLGPQASLADLLEDVTCAVDWLARHAGGDGNWDGGIWLAGHSAGAHLAALHGARGTSRSDAVTEVRGSFLLSGLYELEPLSRCGFLSGKVDFTPEDLAMRSPAHLPAHPDRRHLIAVGSRETEGFRAQRAALMRAWHALDPVSVDVDEANHFSIVDHFADPHHAFHRRVLQEMRSQW